MEELIIEHIRAEVTKKNIKNLRLGIYPVAPKVRISAPHWMSLTAIRSFVSSKRSWIKKQQAKLQNSPPQGAYKFTNGEIHYFNGKPYELQVIEKGPNGVTRSVNKLVLRIRPKASRIKREQVLTEWYRSELKLVLPDLIGKWETRMNVRVREFGVKKMKTRWGTCNAKAKRIWISLHLAKRSPELLEYVVVHELAHLIEVGHGRKFKAIMDERLPHWRALRAELNHRRARRA